MEYNLKSYVLENRSADVWFDHFPAERATLEDPAYPATVEINAVYVGTNDLLCDLDEREVERLTQECFEFMEGDG